MTHEKFSKCVQACNACADACDHCSVACLQEANVADMARCISLDIDCAALCRLAAGFMARDSEFTSAICRACVEACKACAAECGKHDHEHCQQCAQACRECAESCGAMAA